MAFSAEQQGHAEVKATLDGSHFAETKSVSNADEGLTP